MEGTKMKLRIDHRKVNPELFQTLLKLEQFIKGTNLDPVLYELVKIRASQINGCSFCLDMHTSDLRKMGESEQRISLISVWREVPFFSPKERIVLEFTEALTRVSEGGVPQSLFERVREHVSEEEYLALVMAINTINCWNRLAISTGMFPGCYDAARQ
jgi:AhpD family alkylhydroperoxidase